MINIELNPSLGIAIYRQIMQGIKLAISSNKLRPGDKLPSIRELSTALRINPASAVKAYNELRHEGIIVLDQGRGTFVSEDPGIIVRSAVELLRQELQELVHRAAARGQSPAVVRLQLDELIADRISGGPEAATGKASFEQEK